MRFDDKRALKDWYRDDQHSYIRREIYCLLDNNVRRIYSEIDDLRADGHDRGVQELFEKIEEIIHPKYLMRIDFVEELTPDIIPYIDPYPFLEIYESSISLDIQTI